MGKSLFFECEWGAKSNRGKTGTAKTDIHERQTTQHTKIICVFILWELLSHCARRLPSAVVSFAVRWCLFSLLLLTSYRKLLSLHTFPYQCAVCPSHWSLRARIHMVRSNVFCTVVTSSVDDLPASSCAVHFACHHSDHTCISRVVVFVSLIASLSSPGSRLRSCTSGLGRQNTTHTCLVQS